MKNSLTTSALLLLVSVVFFVAVIVNNAFFKDIYVDFSEDKMYSLSDASKQIAKSAKEPIQLYFFFSQENSKGMPVIRDYARRIKSLLDEYAQASGGLITVDMIDPVPFSKAEEQAVSFGLKGASTGDNQETVYIGLAGTNFVGDAALIDFFDPNNEAFLEYELSALLQKLSNPKPSKLTIVTDLDLIGERNELSGNVAKPNSIYSALSELFDVEVVSPTQQILPQKTDVLVLWHAQNISQKLLIEIDQFLMKGGKTLALIDPHYESDSMAQMGFVKANSSLTTLFKGYGIKVDSKQIVLDGNTSLHVRDENGLKRKHLGFLALKQGNIVNSDVTAANLEIINGASFGQLDLAQDSRLQQTSLLVSSVNSSLMPSDDYAKAEHPTEFNDSFAATGIPYILAARYTGAAESFFVNNNPNTNWVSKTNNFNLVVIADADIAADRFWVENKDYFGQQVSTPFANNNDFITNIIENFAGNEWLIGVRSKGVFSRPFIVVEQMRAAAEQQFREQELGLIEQLEQTQAQLVRLNADDTTLVPSKQQLAAIERFTEQKTSIRQALRNIQYELDKNILLLGGFIKVINIVVLPLLLMLFVYFVVRFSRSTAPVIRYSSAVKKQMHNTRNRPMEHALRVNAPTNERLKPVPIAAVPKPVLNESEQRAGQNPPIQKQQTLIDEHKLEVQEEAEEVQKPTGSSLNELTAPTVGDSQRLETVNQAKQKQQIHENLESSSSFNASPLFEDLSDNKIDVAIEQNEQNKQKTLEEKEKTQKSQAQREDEIRQAFKAARQAARERKQELRNKSVNVPKETPILPKEQIEARRTILSKHASTQKQRDENIKIEALKRSADSLEAQQAKVALDTASQAKTGKRAIEKPATKINSTITAKTTKQTQGKSGPLTQADVIAQQENLKGSVLSSVKQANNLPQKQSVSTQTTTQLKKQQTLQQQRTAQQQQKAQQYAVKSKDAALSSSIQQNILSKKHTKGVSTKAPASKQLASINVAQSEPNSLEQAIQQNQPVITKPKGRTQQISSVQSTLQRFARSNQPDPTQQNVKKSLKSKSQPETKKAVTQQAKTRVPKHTHQTFEPELQVWPTTIIKKVPRNHFATNLYVKPDTPNASSKPRHIPDVVAEIVNNNSSDVIGKKNKALSE